MIEIFDARLNIPTYFNIADSVNKLVFSVSVGYRTQDHASATLLLLLQMRSKLSGTSCIF